jgi:hypothetical protein
VFDVYTQAILSFDIDSSSSKISVGVIDDIANAMIKHIDLCKDEVN